MSENKMNGQIQIADEVVGVIAVTAALEVEGVVAGAHGKGIVEFFGKKGHTKCVKIAKDENEAVLDMEIIVKFGTKVQKVAAEVQERVKSTVETMTGLNVAAVNVSVSGVVKEKEAKAEDEE
ncbi:Asp23/Gls24 family envelope stress response protein [Anaerotignum sp.]|nr:Asp23/Gls24 family envelope stress response protein [Anaerotignum sp.]MBQ7758554.1 Asp23/Gls24 family envelope stress response protein [Anaerotignum sp.]